MKRFNLHADTHEDAIKYLKSRFLQIAHTGAVLKKLEIIEEGVWAIAEYAEETCYALYLLEQFRGEGKLYKLYQQKCDEKGYEIKMLTTSACQLAPYFRHKKIRFVLINGLTNTAEYKLIESLYQDDCAKRSGVYFMNHIDEGLYILNKIGAAHTAKLGYILHPVFQEDAYYKNVSKYLLTEIDPLVIINAVEYRHIANDYLSHRRISGIDEIKLSVIQDVNEMLIADKIQNRKDFEIYHKGIHERSKELTEYFANWMAKLNISEDAYQELKEELSLLNSYSYNQ